MFYLVIILIGLGVIVGTFTFFSRSAMHEERIDVAPTCDTCDGSNAKCEQECMMEAAVKEIEYFDDEELDAFRERRSDSYTDEEAESFREVLYTMRPDEVKDWTRSLTLRQISLPDQVKDEVFTILDDI
jgi:hypothetical protein